MIDLKWNFFFHPQNATGKKMHWKRIQKIRRALQLSFAASVCSVPTLLNEFNFRENIWWTDHVSDVNVGQFHVLKRTNQTGCYSDSSPTARIYLFHFVYKAGRPQVCNKRMMAAFDKFRMPTSLYPLNDFNNMRAIRNQRACNCKKSPLTMQMSITINRRINIII